jgi:hypothetical protein
MANEFHPIEWEIWHTYSTYLDGPEIDLFRAAKSLVAAEVAECVVSNTGEAFWRDGDEVIQASLSTSHDLEEGRITFQCHSEHREVGRPSGFALEALGQAVQFRVAEERILGKDLSFADGFVRAFLGKIVVKAIEGDESTADLNLYPTLLIYESGVLILELRMIGPVQPIPLGDFIAYAVNLPRMTIQKALVSPGLARMATEAYYRSAYVPFFSRFRYSSSQRLHNQAVAQLTTEVQDDENLSFRLSRWSGETHSFREIAMSIFHTCAYLIDEPRRGLAFIVFGAKTPPDLGAFWSARPHIHLIRYQDQREAGQENNQVHARAFYSILSRTLGLAKPLPKDLRLFDDYSAFITSSASLWAWSKSGYKQQKKNMDPNRANFIYERQILMELLEYGYMLHRGLYHRVEVLQSTDQVMSVRRLILQLRLRMRETSHSGEIRELLEEGWDALGLPSLIHDIDGGLALREADMRSADTMRTTRVGWAIAIVFGIVAVPPLADQIVTPTWHLLKLRVIGSADTMKLVTAGVATLAILALLAVVLLFLSRRDRRF